MKEELLDYGLSEKEIDVYITCLKLGSASAQRISQLTKIRRSTVYEVIETLKKKALLSSFKKDTKLQFSASSPSSLIRLLQNKEWAVRRILPELDALASTIAEKPGVEMFEGISGIKKACEDMLSSKEIKVYGASRLADHILGPFTANFAKRRVEKKIVMHALIEQDVPGHMKEKDVAKFTKIKSSTLFKDHPAVYFLYDNKFLMITFRQELFAVRMTSAVLVDSQKKIFEGLWKST